MDAFLKTKEENKDINVGLWVGVLIAVLFVAGIIGAVSLITPAEREKSNVLEGAVSEGSAEFEKYTKDVVISTNTNRLMQSFTGLGTITMHIGGSVYNKGDKTLTTIQARVGVVDSENKVIKERDFILLPNSKRKTISPGKTMTVSVNIGGFKRDDDRANVRWKVIALKVEKEVSNN